MSLTNEAVQKLFQEIEQKVAFSQQQMTIVKAQIQAKARETRLLQLTATEVDSLPEGTNVYEGVGKMFVWSPTSDVKKRLEGESKELKTETESLEKKLHYFETTHKNAIENMERLLKPGGS